MVPDIYNSLAEKINFTYTLQKSRDGSWGSVNQVGVGPGTFHDFYSLPMICTIFSCNFVPRKNNFNPITMIYNKI
jgi:hypothetical protein